MQSALSTLKNKRVEQTLFRSRFITLGCILLFLMFLLVGRLFYLGILKFSQYQTLSKQNQLNILSIPPTRGLIYDRNGILLAKNIPIYTLELMPEKIAKMEPVLERLHKIISLTAEEISLFKKALKQHRRFEWVPIKFKLTEEEVAFFSVNKIYFPGIEVKARLIRSYPYGATMAHVLGFVGRINAREYDSIDQNNYQGTNFIGKVGIEKYYESFLHGKVGHEQVETDASSRVVRTIKNVSSESGAHLVLSIDIKLQQAAEAALKDQQGAIVAIDPNNGEILALSSVPSYDPNLFVKGIDHKSYELLATSDKQPLYNRAIRGQYPLASTIKPFVALKALEDNIVSKAYKVFDPGWFKLPHINHLYRDWKRFGHGWVNLEQALVVSCDTYFYQLASLMGIQRIDDILSQFGFGQLTQIDLGEELPGLVPSPEWKKMVKGTPWYTGDTIISGIGQGFMLTTPLQLANAVAKLANKGKSFRPHLLKTVLTTNNRKDYKPIEEFPITLKNTPIWKTIIQAMAASVTKREGTGGYHFGRNPPYTVAIKTGTAQVYSIKQHQQEASRELLPEHLRDHSIVIAFAPIDHPKIALAVLVENNNIASSVARKVIDNYLLRNQNADNVSQSNSKP